MPSMTGYGRAQAALDGREMTVELKSVNHRFLDLSFRNPRALNFFEEEARRILSGAFSRGHIDVMVQYRNQREDARQVIVDEVMAVSYARALERVAAAAGASATLDAARLASFPEVLAVHEREEDQEAVAALYRSVLGAAIGEMARARAAEGGHLESDILEKIGALEKVVEDIAGRAPMLAEAWQAKLQERMANLLQGATPDPARIVQEAALLAERAAVDEEIVRLKAHIASVRRLLASPPSGKKLDFTVQEMNREINTVGSKASDLSLISWVVEGKALIEKVREQVQNLE